MKRSTLIKMCLHVSSEILIWNNHAHNLLDNSLHLSANAGEFVALMSLRCYKVAHQFKISRHEKERSSQSHFTPATADRLLAILFHFSPRNLDLDRFRQAYQAREWHNLYYMHGDSGGDRVGGGHPWRGYDGLMVRDRVWYGMAVVVRCISITLRITRATVSSWISSHRGQRKKPRHQGAAAF